MLEQLLRWAAVPVLQPWHTVRAPDPAPRARLASLPHPDMCVFLCVCVCVCVCLCVFIIGYLKQQANTLGRSCSLSWLAFTICLAFSLSFFHPNRKAKGDSVHFWVSVLPGPWVAFWVQWTYDCFWMTYGSQIHTPVLLRVLSIHGLVYGSTLIPLSLALCVCMYTYTYMYIHICIYICICVCICVCVCIYIYSSPQAAIAIPAALQFKVRVKWNRHQFPGSPQVGWNIAQLVFFDHSGLREASGGWSRVHCPRQEEGTGE